MRVQDPGGAGVLVFGPDGGAYVEVGGQVVRVFARWHEAEGGGVRLVESGGGERVYTGQGLLREESFVLGFGVALAGVVRLEYPGAAVSGGTGRADVGVPGPGSAPGRAGSAVLSVPGYPVTRWSWSRRPDGAVLLQALEPAWSVSLLRLDAAGVLVFEQVGLDTIYDEPGWLGLDLVIEIDHQVGVWRLTDDGAPARRFTVAAAGGGWVLTEARGRFAGHTIGYDRFGRILPAGRRVDRERTGAVPPRLSLERVRVYGPGGVQPVPAESTAALRAAFPSDGHGEPVRPRLGPRGGRAVPSGPDWLALVNPAEPGEVSVFRELNCIECAIAMHLCQRGVPTVAAALFHEYDAHGAPVARGEPMDKLERFAGRRLDYQGQDPEGVRELEARLVGLGPGASAIGVFWFTPEEQPDGIWHTFNAVNEDGRVFYTDPELHTVIDLSRGLIGAWDLPANTRLYALVFDPEDNPVHYRPGPEAGPHVQPGLPAPPEAAGAPTRPHHPAPASPGAMDIDEPEPGARRVWWEIEHLDQARYRVIRHLGTPSDPANRDLWIYRETRIERRTMTAQPQPWMQHAFPWRDPADPIHRPHPWFQDHAGRLHPATATGPVKAAWAWGQRNTIRNINEDEDDTRLQIDPDSLEQAMEKIRRNVQDEVTRRIRALPGGPQHIRPDQLTRNDLRPHERDPHYLTQHGLFLADITTPGRRGRTHPPAQAPRHLLPTAANGHFLDLYPGALITTLAEEERWTAAHPNYPQYTVEIAILPPGRARTRNTAPHDAPTEELFTHHYRISAEGAAGHAAFANTTLPDTGELRVDRPYTNTILIQFDITLHDRHDQPLTLGIFALLALDNIIDPENHNPRGHILLDYGDNIAEIIHPPGPPPIKQEPDNDHHNP